MTEVTTRPDTDPRAVALRDFATRYVSDTIDMFMDRYHPAGQMITESLGRCSSELEFGDALAHMIASRNIPPVCPEPGNPNCECLSCGFVALMERSVPVEPVLALAADPGLPMDYRIVLAEVAGQRDGIPTEVADDPHFGIAERKRNRRIDMNPVREDAVTASDELDADDLRKIAAQLRKDTAAFTAALFDWIDAGLADDTGDTAGAVALIIAAAHLGDGDTFGQVLSGLALAGSDAVHCEQPRDAKCECVFCRFPLAAEPHRFAVLAEGIESTHGEHVYIDVRTVASPYRRAYSERLPADAADAVNMGVLG